MSDTVTTLMRKCYALKQVLLTVLLLARTVASTESQSFCIALLIFWLAQT